ncbi:MAG: hypothetical protein KAS86_00220, partial [Candidatus Omnitrophica bacterium]|nr:hypothetical protein [Candidatus Omnitrophota bacterium]
MISWKQRHAFFIKCVSTLVIGIFLHQQIGWTQGGKPVWVQARPFQVTHQDKLGDGRFEIPHDIASTNEVVMNGGDEIVVHIQDAHASLSAQYSIAGLLDSLVSKYDLSFVALEGSAGYIDTSILKAFPDKDIRRDTASFLMREGRMSAGEFFEITCDAEDISLYGIEDEKLYRENLESFRALAAARAAQTEGLNGLINQLRGLGEKIYSKDLKLLNDNCVLHREGGLSFSDHWKVVRDLTAKYRIDISVYTGLSKLVESIELEKSIDFEKANSERRKLIDRLSRDMKKKELEELVLRSLAFKQNRLSQGDYHGYLVNLAETRGVPAEGYENLIKFTRYILIYESVELLELYREIEELESGIRERMYRDDDEKELYNITRTARLLKQLYAMELNNREFRYLKRTHVEFTAERYAAFIREKCEKYGVAITGGYDISGIMSGIDGAMKFYRDAEARNNAMLANTLKRMRAEGKHVGALITGGYHTEGLTGLMRQKGLSYLVVVPKFESGRERPYVAILTNKKKPYEKLLEAGKYQLAVSAYFHDYRGDLTRLKPALFHALGEAAIEGKDTARVKNLWKEAYSRAYEAVPDSRKKTMGFEPVSPGEFEEFLDRVSIQEVRNAAVIAEVTATGVSFITLIKKGEIFEFNPTSRAQRDVFLRRTAATSEEEKGAAEFTMKFRELEADILQAGEMAAGFEDITCGLARSVAGLDEIANRLDPRGKLAETLVKELDGAELNADNVREKLRDLGDEGLSLAQDWEHGDAAEIVGSFIDAVRQSQKQELIKMFVWTRAHVYRNTLSTIFGFIKRLGKSHISSEAFEKYIGTIINERMKITLRMDIVSELIRMGIIVKDKGEVDFPVHGIYFGNSKVMDKDSQRRILAEISREGTKISEENREILDSLWRKEKPELDQTLDLSGAILGALQRIGRMDDPEKKENRMKGLADIGSRICVLLEDVSRELDGIVLEPDRDPEQMMERFNGIMERLQLMLQLLGDSPEKIMEQHRKGEFEKQEEYYPRQWADSIDDSGRLVKGFARALLEAGRPDIFYNIIKSEEKEDLIRAINKHLPYISRVRRYMDEKAAKGHEELWQTMKAFQFIDEKGIDFVVMVTSLSDMEDFKYAGEFAKKVIEDGMLWFEETPEAAPGVEEEPARPGIAPPKGILSPKGSAIVPLLGGLGLFFGIYVFFGFTTALAATGAGLVTVWILERAGLLDGLLKRSPVLRRFIRKPLYLGITLLWLGLGLASGVVSTWDVTPPSREPAEKELKQGVSQPEIPDVILPAPDGEAEEKVERPGLQREDKLRGYENMLKSGFDEYFAEMRQTAYFEGRKAELPEGEDELMLGSYFTRGNELRMPAEYEDDRPMPQTRVNRLNDIVDRVWERMDKAALPGYIKSKVGKDGRPVEGIQKMLFVLKVLDPEAYEYAEKWNIRIVFVETDRFAGAVSGDRYFGTAVKNPRGAKIKLRSGMRTLQTTWAFRHEIEHHKDFPTRLWQVYTSFLSYIQEIPGIFFDIVPSYERNSFRAEREFIKN